MPACTRGPSLPSCFAVAVLAATLLLAACGAPADAGFQGYVEGEFVNVAAPLAGRLERSRCSGATRCRAARTSTCSKPSAKAPANARRARSSPSRRRGWTT